MYYSWNITLTKGRTKSTPEKTTLQLEKGVIVRCEVVFPSGCSGLAYCHIDRSLHQVYPKNPDYQFAGNGETVQATDEYELVDEPFHLDFFGWNTDEIYNHTITVRLQIVPRREIVRLALSEMLRFLSMSKPGG